jgi:hypothetical protein
MKFGSKTALGVDISETLISMALLKGNDNSVKLLKTASAPIPDGAIKNGNIENAKALATAIRRLKNRITIRSTQAVVSLFTKPVIVQIMDISKQPPSNIRQFVQSQMKHCAVLPGKKIALDFCGTSGIGSETGIASRILAIATDGQKVTEIIKVCGQAGITVEAIEPPLLAYTRALYDKKIAGKFDSNVLIAILREDTLTLCVFRRQTLDFVRTNNISKEKAEPGELCQTSASSVVPWLAEQVNTVIEFYDVEVPDSCGKWEITVVADCMQLPDDAEGSLKAKIASTDLQLLTGEDISQATVVSQSGRFANRHRDNKPSPVAIGLAMKLLRTKTRNLGVNLLPPELARLRVIKKEALITANIAAAVLLIMILATNGPIWKIKSLNESISHKKANISRDTDTLVKERIWLDEKINTINNKLNQINKILGLHCDTDWPRLLNDIGKVTPKTVLITSLSSKANSGMSLEGLALSNEDVYLFVDKLNKSKYIDSASIVETEKDLNNNGLTSYEISCSLTARKGG